MRGPLLLLAVLAAASTGCETFQPAICDRTPEDNPAVLYTQGTAAGGVYLSSPWDGELLLFRGGMRYDLQHHLGAAPRWTQTYLSFERYGTSDGGSLAPAAGNQAVVEAIDDQVVRIANDSCADYWLLVAAGSTATPATPP
jgi:hypothetical protein